MSRLEVCGPYERGTATLVAASDGAEFSYQRGFEPPTRTPVPGERVSLKWTTSDDEDPTGDGIVISVEFPNDPDRRVRPPSVLVLWSVEPRRPKWDPDEDFWNGTASRWELP